MIASLGVADGGQTDRGLNDADWYTLVTMVRNKYCTPFLGAGACVPTLPLGGQIAMEWATSVNYPFSDSSNLVRVAQYMAVQSAFFPHTRLINEFNARIHVQKKVPNFDDENEPHRFAADLQQPVYVTTNYDNFLTRALERRVGAGVRRIACDWRRKRNDESETREPGPFSAQGTLNPTENTPIVFHMHGLLEDINSMVLTEDDYLEFLIEMTKQDTIPREIQKSLANPCLLFLGYSMEDLNFKVLFQKLMSYRRREGPCHISVQLAPSSTDPARAVEYLRRYLGNLKVRVYLGTCDQFAADYRAAKARLVAQGMVPP
jgi:hypothetical protein